MTDSQGAPRRAESGRLTYPPVQGEPDCLRCGLLRRFGTTPDDVLLDHIAGHPTGAKP